MDIPFQNDHFQHKIQQFNDSEQQIGFGMSENSFQLNMDFFSQIQKDEETVQIRQIQYKSQGQVLIKKQKQQICHCKKTRCLKMYCQCFSQGKVCSSQCVCIGCQNDEKNNKNKLSSVKTIQKIQTQNTSYLKQETKNYSNKGCNCKKSHCQKKYCQCLNANRKCTQSCQCVECNNCISTQHTQKYKSSVNSEKILQIQNKENQEQQSLIQEVQTLKRQDSSFILMSNQLLAEIDGYITG